MFESKSDQWQDPCLTQVVSMSRLAVLVALFLIMCSSWIILVLLEDRPYGIQFSTLVGYTAAVAFYTFSHNRNGNQSFLVSCPAVHGQLGRLIRRHLGFITAIFIAQTTALRLRPGLPTSWIIRSVVVPPPKGQLVKNPPFHQQPQPARRFPEARKVQ
jgi:hypothetical protein